MGVISRLYNFVAGTPAVADQVDAEFDQILGVLNGNIDAANLAAGAVTVPKLATATLNNFLKLATAADRKLALGLDGSAPGGASWGVSPEVTGSQAHGLGSTPSFVFLTAGTGVTTASGASVVAASVVSVDATNINYKLRAVDGGNANFPGVKLFWAAIS